MSGLWTTLWSGPLLTLFVWIYPYHLRQFFMYNSFCTKQQRLEEAGEGPAPLNRNGPCHE